MRYEYDTLGRLWKLHTYQGGTGWNSVTLPAAFTSATAATTTWTYRPGTNALWKKTDTLNRSVTYTYDPDGFLWKKENARSTTATYSYAQTSGGKKIPDRVSGISYDDGVTPAVAFSYHPDGSLKTVTDAAGTQGINLSGSSTLVRNSVYYGNGLLNGVVFNRTQIDEDHPLTLQLNVAGEPVLPDANGSLSYNNPVSVFSQSYDWWLGKKLVLMNTGGLSYSYHNGLVRRRSVLGLGHQTNFRYMPDGAIKSIATETRRYSYRGRMMGIHGGSDSWDYTFDSRGRRETQTWGDWTPYSPDYLNQYPRRWRYQYNERGEVETADREGLLQDEGTLIEPLSHQRRNYEYDLMGNRQTATQGTTTTEQADFTQVYTPQALQQYSGIIRGRMAEITGAAPEDAIVSLRIDDGVPFTVDRTQLPSQTVEHNSFRHLHTVTGPNADEARWVKMEFTATEGGGSTQRRGFVYVPPANEVPQYDLDGNLIQDGRWVYTWDAENRLTSATQKVINCAPGVEGPKHQRLEFAYDYMNRRIAKKVFVQESVTGLQPVVWRLTKDLRFVYNGYQMIAELDATFATGTGVAGITPTRGVVRTYQWGLDVSGTLTGAGGVGGLIAFTFQGVSYYPISDANGNICAIHAYGTDQVIRFDYDPFGNRITNTGPDVEICPMGFSSKYTDSETGLVDYGLRIYSPPMARFLSRDPIEEQGGVNLYGFVGNDPVNKWDYLGLEQRTLVLAVGPDVGDGVEVGGPNPNRESTSVIPILRNELGYLPVVVNFSAGRPIRTKQFFETMARTRFQQRISAGYKAQHTVDFKYQYTPTSASATQHLSQVGNYFALMAHGDPAPIETGVIFEVPGAKISGHQIAAAYPLGKVITNTVRPPNFKIGVSCCYPGNLPKKVGYDLGVVPLVADPTSKKAAGTGAAVSKIIDAWECLMGFTK